MMGTNVTSGIPGSAKLLVSTFGLTNNNSRENDLLPSARKAKAPSSFQEVSVEDPSLK